MSFLDENLEPVPEDVLDFYGTMVPDAEPVEGRTLEIPHNPSVYEIETIQVLGHNGQPIRHQYVYKTRLTPEAQTWADECLQGKFWFLGAGDRRDGDRLQPTVLMFFTDETDYFLAKLRWG